MATQVLREKDARLDFRIRPDLKDRIEKAANVSGRTVTDFAVSTLVDMADEVLERHNVAQLSNRDRDVFLRILDRDATPNAKLLRAGKTHKKLIVE